MQGFPAAGLSHGSNRRPSLRHESQALERLNQPQSSPVQMLQLLPSTGRLLQSLGVWYPTEGEPEPQGWQEASFVDPRGTWGGSRPASGDKAVEERKGRSQERGRVPGRTAARNEKHVVHLTEELNGGSSRLKNQTAKEGRGRREGGRMWWAAFTNCFSCKAVSFRANYSGHKQTQSTVGAPLFWVGGQRVGIHSARYGNQLSSLTPTPKGAGRPPPARRKAALQQVSRVM